VNVSDDGATSAKKCKEEVITPLVELPKATVVHQLLQQGHNEVNINGIVAQNGTTTLQVNIRLFFYIKTKSFFFSFNFHRQVVVQQQVKKFHKQFY
jgi:hypothetical protein